MADKKEASGGNRIITSYFLGIISLIFVCMGLTQLISILINNFVISGISSDIQGVMMVLYGLFGAASIMFYGLILGIIGLFFQKKISEETVRKKIKKISSFAVWISGLGILVAITLAIRTAIILNNLGGIN